MFIFKFIKCDYFIKNYFNMYHEVINVKEINSNLYIIIILFLILKHV